MATTLCNLRLNLNRKMWHSVQRQEKSILKDADILVSLDTAKVSKSSCFWVPWEMHPRPLTIFQKCICELWLIVNWKLQFTPASQVLLTFLVADWGKIKQNLFLEEMKRLNQLNYSKKEKRKISYCVHENLSLMMQNSIQKGRLIVR